MITFAPGLRVENRRAFSLWTALRIFAVSGILMLALPVASFGISPAPSPAGAPAVAISKPPRARTYLPAVSHGSVRSGACPATGASYRLIPVLPPPTDRPAVRHADLNLALRGSEKVDKLLGLVDYGGDTDWGAPQLNGMFSGGRIPAFSSTWQVYDWDWGCGPDGCRSGLISQPEVTLLGLASRPGEALAAPTRPAELYPGGFTTLVLYAEEHRITLKYTREDNVVSGYTVQLEGICVDPDLLELYRGADAAGRGALPGLLNGQALGTAVGTEILAAIRDCGSYMDPRSRKDWWIVTG